MRSLDDHILNSTLSKMGSNGKFYMRGILSYISLKITLVFIWKTSHQMARTEWKEDSGGYSSDPSGADR